MPITFAEMTTPARNRVLRTRGVGIIDAADARLLQDQVRVGAPFHGCPMLSIQESDSHFTVEGRQAFVSFGEAIPAVAVVVTSAPIRVMLNFVIRASRTASNAPTNVRFFSQEPEAVAWLDAELAKPSAP